MIKISDGEKLHYLAVKSLSALLNCVTSKHNGDSYCLNCFHSYRTEKVSEKHMKICKDKDYCYIEMPEKDTFINYHPGVKSMRAPFVIYADLESLLNKMDTCTNGPNKSSTTKKKKHEMCGYSLITHCSFDEKNNTKDYYRVKDCLRKFFQDLKKQGKSIVDFEKK